MRSKVSAFPRKLSLFFLFFYPGCKTTSPLFEHILTSPLMKSTLRFLSNVTWLTWNWASNVACLWKDLQWFFLFFFKHTDRKGLLRWKITKKKFFFSPRVFFFSFFFNWQKSASRLLTDFFFPLTGIWLPQRRVPALLQIKFHLIRLRHRTAVSYETALSKTQNCCLVIKAGRWSKNGASQKWPIETNRQQRAHRGEGRAADPCLLCRNAPTTAAMPIIAPWRKELSVPMECVAKAVR